MYGQPQQQQQQQQQYGQGPTLAIVAHGAQNLQDVESFGKQDPYLQFSLDFNNAKSFQKTFVHKNAGKTPTWNQSFSVPLSGEPELYIEIMDDETTADAVIAFAAIPVNQVVHAPGGTMNAVFDVYSPNGKQQGQVNLTLTAFNVPGQNTGYGGQAAAAQPVKGTSHISELHQKRIKSLKSKETAADVGTVALGGLLAVGTGLLVNKLVNDHKHEEDARKEAERQAQLEREKFEKEKRLLEEERAEFQRTQSQEQARFQQDQGQFQQQQQQQYQQYQQQPGGYEHGRSGYRDEHGSHGRRDEHGHRDEHQRRHHGSDSGSDSDDSHKKSKKGKTWDAQGHWYSPGDKVKYDGSKYICLQGHNSQPDWAPTAAHSLWRRD